MRILFLLGLLPILCFGIDSNLQFGGDIICEWQYIHTKSRGRRLRGSGAYTPHLSYTSIPTSEITTQVDLYIGYEKEPSYGRIELQFDNACGLLVHNHRHKKAKNALMGSGEADALDLYKAYMGYHLAKNENSSFDLEIGRRPLFDIFDSKIEFYNNFDGILLSYWQKASRWGGFNAKIASFVIDRRVNHFGYVGEVDFLSIYGSGLNLKYSLISWDRRGHNRYNKRHPYGARFVNSQLLAIVGIPKFLEKDPSIYLAGLHNHRATPNRFTHSKRAANAFYGGITLGQVQKKNDWSIDLNYQWVEAQSIPHDDVSGIGRDNPLDLSLYHYSWAGTTNYKGYAATLVYGLTDDLTLTLSFEQAHQISSSIGGKYRSNSLQLSTTYTF